jgi:hypothetical protein
MRYIGGQSSKPELQRELSWFLIAYLMMLLGVLLGVHLLQPTEHTAESSQVIAAQGKFRTGAR